MHTEGDPCLLGQRTKWELEPEPEPINQPLTIATFLEVPLAHSHSSWLMSDQQHTPARCTGRWCPLVTGKSKLSRDTP